MPPVEAMLVLLRKNGVVSATFSESGALLSVTLGPDPSQAPAETQSDTAEPRPRSATPRLVPRGVSDRE